MPRSGMKGGREDATAGADAPEPNGEPAARSTVRHGAEREAKRERRGTGLAGGEEL